MRSKDQLKMSLLTTLLTERTKNTSATLFDDHQAKDLTLFYLHKEPKNTSGILHDHQPQDFIFLTDCFTNTYMYLHRTVQQEKEKEG